MAEKLGYRPGLDGLRGVAVALVVCVHLWPRGWLPGGWIGVDIFFVLSGFLITSLLVDELDRAGTVDVVRFLARRAVRLVPALALVLAVSWFVLADPSTRHAVPLAFAYVANLPASGGASLGGLQHAWSLAVEEQFYVLWALAVPFVWRCRRPVIVLGVVIAAVAAWRSWLLMGSTDDLVWFRLDTRADGLLAGAILAFRPAWRPRCWLVAVAGAVAGWVVFAPPLGAPMHLLATGGSVVLVAAAQDWRTTEVFRWVGRRSYGIYLWHYPAWIYAERQMGADAWRLAVPFTLLAAMVSYEFVEMPLRRRLRVGDDRRDAPVFEHRLARGVECGDHRSDLDVSGSRPRSELLHSDRHA